MNLNVLSVSLLTLCLVHIICEEQKALRVVEPEGSFQPSVAFETPQVPACSNIPSSKLVTQLKFFPVQLPLWVKAFLQRAPLVGCLGEWRAVSLFFQEICLRISLSS